jgi:hypothetical protein
MTKTCARCNGTMQGYSLASVDQKTIVTTWLCARCLRREHSIEKNPRFTPFATGVKHPEFQRHEREY